MHSFFKDLEFVFGVYLVCKLLGKCFDDISESFLQNLLNKCVLSIKLILEVFEPFHEFVSQLVQGIFELSYFLCKRSNGRVINRGTRFWNFEIGKLLSEPIEFLFQSCNTSLELFKVSVFELVKFCAKLVMLMT